MNSPTGFCPFLYDGDKRCHPSRLSNRNMDKLITICAFEWNECPIYAVKLVESKEKTKQVRAATQEIDNTVIEELLRDDAPVKLELTPADYEEDSEEESGLSLDRFTELPAARPPEQEKPKQAAVEANGRDNRQNQKNNNSQNGRNQQQNAGRNENKGNGNNNRRDNRDDSRGQNNQREQRRDIAPRPANGNKERQEQVQQPKQQSQPQKQGDPRPAPPAPQQKNAPPQQHQSRPINNQPNNQRGSDRGRQNNNRRRGHNNPRTGRG